MQSWNPACGTGSWERRPGTSARSPPWMSPIRPTCTGSSIPEPESGARLRCRYRRARPVVRSIGTPPRLRSSRRRDGSSLVPQGPVLGRIGGEFVDHHRERHGGLRGHRSSAPSIRVIGVLQIRLASLPNQRGQDEAVRFHAAERSWMLAMATRRLKKSSKQAPVGLLRAIACRHHEDLSQVVLHAVVEFTRRRVSSLRSRSVPARD